MAMLPPSSAKSSDHSLPEGALVMYEQENQPLLAVIRGSRKNKMILFNERGREVELSANRIHRLPGTLPPQCTRDEDVISHLEDLHTKADAASAEITLEELWTVVVEENRSFTQKELVELYHGEDSLIIHMALRIAIIQDPIFFKRKRDVFVPRPFDNVEELRKALAAKDKKERLLDDTIAFISQRLEGSSDSIPEELSSIFETLEQIACRTSSIDTSKLKEVKILLDRISDETSLSLKGPREHRALFLLQKIKHFHSFTNVPLIKHAVPISFTEEELAAAKAITVPPSIPEFPDHQHRMDLTGIHTFTIDDASTKDMDDALSVEQTTEGYRLGIHITDVASVITHGSILDQTGIHRGTSLYLADTTVNMLPPSLSHNVLSLVAGEIRPCLSVLCTINPRFEIIDTEIVETFVRVDKNYSYDDVDTLLHSDDPTFAALYNVALERESERFSNDGFKVHKRDIQVVLKDKNTLDLIEIDEHSPARSLVGEMMILANEIHAHFADKHNIPFFFRSQERREEQDPDAFKDIPDGPALDYAVRSGLRPSSMTLTPAPHATLGLERYTQVTSPIRRYLDLLHQRQIKGYLRSGTPQYAPDELQTLWMLNEPALQRAGMVNREARRFWFYKYLEQRSRTDKEIRGVVIRTDLKTPLIELDEIFFSVLQKINVPIKPGDTFLFKINKVNAAFDELRLEIVKRL